MVWLTIRELIRGKNIILHDMMAIFFSFLFPFFLSFFVLVGNEAFSKVTLMTRPNLIKWWLQKWHLICIYFIHLYIYIDTCVSIYYIPSTILSCFWLFCFLDFLILFFLSWSFCAGRNHFVGASRNFLFSFFFFGLLLKAYVSPNSRLTLYFINCNIDMW